ncbi:histidine phosphatase family (branch 2) protein (macronuclear) [Tetrahymena thermophila SB210]|uniref:Histidine phosphatase family (Branch 2) protein n=1 Tax=Tetrahymena thermophila (strain SB210) TaxID=312017 RepID=Q22AM1_TETTS|nr:histidine phosphatase family (branch 2) protein [Tetrahymena thermophila SB210]EAR82335.3 histidine phosphatase family (branch 2) protein [Tetrahymena thermophila SB210]|eukprot:XP_001029998.3 histidine phosphatase family (branch 2) protein [Tetrahymena thermophila SB210]
MSNLLKTIVILLAITTAVYCTVDEYDRMKKSTLKLVVQIYRHGARYPIYDKTYDAAEQKKMNGELTPVGIRQQFELGRKLRAEYITSSRAFLSTSYNPQELYVRSTDVTRTLMSAESQLAGLYPYGTGPKIPTQVQGYSADQKKQILDAPYKFFDQSISQDMTDDANAIPNGYQPIPIHTISQNQDKLLLGMSYGCPNSQKWTAQNKQSDEWKRINKELSDTISKFAKIMIKDETQLASFDLTSLQQNMDTLISDYFQGRDIPTEMKDKDFWEKIEQLLYLEIHLELLKTKQQKQVSITPFFNSLIGYFEKKLNNTAPYKWYMHSAHDTTTSMILVGMNLTSWECMERYHTNQLQKDEVCIYQPTTYATNLMYELREDPDTHQNFVMFSMNGQYLPICDQTSKYCDYEEFKRRIAQQVVPDFDQQCGFIEAKAAEVQQYTFSSSLTFISISLLLLSLL